MSDTSARDYTVCKCCGGTGVQHLLSGEKIKCKCCNGSGDWNNDTKITY